MHHSHPMQGQDHPFLYYENTAGGHSGTVNNEQTAEEIALDWTYLLQKLK